MKVLLVLAVLAIAYFLWRQARMGERNKPGRNDAARAKQDALPQDMVRCPVCAVHLPRGDAIAGPGGALYCSQEHRQLGGR